MQRKRKYALRDVLDAIFWTLRVGSHGVARRWRNLPESFPKWESVYNYFRKWKKDNTLENLNFALNRLERERIGKKSTPSMFCIDSQSIKAAPFVKEEKGIDGNKKINGRKRHIITDTIGLVWAVIVYGGAPPPANQHDGVTAEKVVEPLQGYMHRMKKILADDAYKIRFMNWVNANLLGVNLELSSKPPSAQGFVPVKWRWVSERTFAP